jgi:hypothetical protein
VIDVDGSAADNRSLIEETGDSGWELRMAAWRSEAAIIRMRQPNPWQYRGELPGLLGQAFPLG